MSNGRYRELEWLGTRFTTTDRQFEVWCNKAGRYDLWHRADHVGTYPTIDKATQEAARLAGQPIEKGRAA